MKSAPKKHSGTRQARLRGPTHTPCRGWHAVGVFNVTCRRQPHQVMSGLCAPHLIFRTYAGRQGLLAVRHHRRTPLQRESNLVNTPFPSREASLLGWLADCLHTVSELMSISDRSGNPSNPPVLCKAPILSCIIHPLKRHPAKSTRHTCTSTKSPVCLVLTMKVAGLGGGAVDSLPWSVQGGYQ